MSLNLQQSLKTTKDLEKKIEIYIHKIINSNSNVYRTFNNNVIIHKTQNKLPEPKYSATEISISIASSWTSVKTMVTLGNQVGSNPGKHIQMNINNIFYIIKSAIISVPSNTWQRSFRTTLHSLAGYQWTRHTVKSSHGELVTQWNRHSELIINVATDTVNSSHGELVTRWTRHSELVTNLWPTQCSHLSSQYCISIL